MSCNVFIAVELTDSRLSCEYSDWGGIPSEGLVVTCLKTVVNVCVFVADQDFPPDGKGGVDSEDVTIRTRGCFMVARFVVVLEFVVARILIRFRLKAAVGDDTGVWRRPPFCGLVLHALSPEFCVQLMQGLIAAELYKGLQLLRAVED